MLKFEHYFFARLDGDDGPFRDARPVVGEEEDMMVGARLFQHIVADAVPVIV